MATSALARLTGFVLKSDRRQGTSTKTGSPVPYDFTQIKVVVADSDVTEVTLPRNESTLAGGFPAKGDAVDYLVEFRLNANGRGLQGSVISDYPEES